jgi:hypothetical protein
LETVIKPLGGALGGGRSQLAAGGARELVGDGRSGLVVDGAQ